MTEKQEKILASALELFAKEGFHATSTSRVARHAGVSEGLIFRHFGNKEGLLEAILKEGEERVQRLFSDIVFESDPALVIRKYLDLLVSLVSNPEELEFWKLQYKIKWETEQYGEHKMKPIFHALSGAFDKLGYPDPQQEANVLLALVDGLATHYFLQDSFDVLAMIAFLKTKYKV